MQIKSIFAGNTLALVALAATFTLTTAPSFAQSAGDTILSAGWLHIAPQDSSTPLTSTSSTVPSFSNTLAGSGATAESSNTVGLSISNFLTDNWAAVLDIGIPPKYKLNGTGSLASAGRIGTAKQWAPAVLGKYYFGAPNAQWRPSLGFGFARVSYTDIELTGAFQQNLGARLGNPNAVTTANLSNSWAPVFNAGLSYAINKDWYANLSVSYLKLKTDGNLTTVTNGPLGNVTSKTTLTLDPLVTYLNVGYRF